MKDVKMDFKKKILLKDKVSAGDYQTIVEIEGDNGGWRKDSSISYVRPDRTVRKSVEIEDHDTDMWITLYPITPSDTPLTFKTDLCQMADLVLLLRTIDKTHDRPGMYLSKHKIVEYTETRNKKEVIKHVDTLKYSDDE